MAPEKQAGLTTTQKIKNSSWKRGKIAELLGLNPNKFAEKMRHNSWEDKEISVLKKKEVID